MTYRFILFVFILIFSSGLGYIKAQETDSLKVPLTTEPENGPLFTPPISIIDTTASDSIKIDSIVVEEKVRFKLIKSILDNKYPNPNRAAALSFILPGSGQVYNKKIWKLPFVYGALGGLGYMTYFNNRQYKTFKKAYLFEVDEDATTLNPFPGLTESALLRLRDRYNKRRQQGYIFFVFAWVLNSVDAYVDAHLASFDVSEDISMHINPVGLTLGNTNAYGLSVRFTQRQVPSKKVIF